MHSPIRLGRVVNVFHNEEMRRIAPVDCADWAAIQSGRDVFVAVKRRLTPYYGGGGMNYPVASGALYAGRILHNGLVDLDYDGHNRTPLSIGSLVLEASAGPVWGNLPGCHPHQPQLLAGPVLTLQHTDIFRIYFLLPPDAPRPGRRKRTTAK